jgi:hypothetical protein
VSLRKKVVLEVYKTERDYLADLAVLAKVFEQPLLAAALVTTEQARTLFGNAQELAEVNRQHLLEAMSAKFDAAEAAHSDIGAIELGDVFLHFVCASSTGLRVVGAACGGVQAVLC